MSNECIVFSTMACEMISPSLPRAKDLVWANVYAFPVPCPNSPKSLCDCHSPFLKWITLEGEFYWRIISQLSFHEALPCIPLLSLITLWRYLSWKASHCAPFTYFFYLSEKPISRLCLGAFYFNPVIREPSVSVVQGELQPPRSPARHSSRFHRSLPWSLWTRCHWMFRNSNTKYRIGGKKITFISG